MRSDIGISSFVITTTHNITILSSYRSLLPLLIFPVSLLLRNNLLSFLPSPVCLTTILIKPFLEIAFWCSSLFLFSHLLAHPSVGLLANRRAWCFVIVFIVILIRLRLWP